MFITGLQTEMENAGPDQILVYVDVWEKWKLRKKTHNDVRVFLRNFLY